MAENIPVRYDTVDVAPLEDGGLVADHMGFYEAAQAKRGRRKEKFKQTEVGLIPEDWEVSRVGEVFRLLNGKAFAPRDWKPSGAPIIRIQNLNDPDASFNYFRGSIPQENRVESGDLLFAWSGTTGTSFGARVWRGPAGVLNQHIFKVEANDRLVTAPFAFLVLRNIQEAIEKQSHGFKASFVHVKKTDLVKVSLPRPPLPEQQAIAAALSDVGELLGALDRLIAKKRDLKQAAMQELLTGKRRLPGFTKPWETKTLEEVGLITGAGVDKKIRPNEVPVRLVNYMDVYRRDSVYSSELDHHVTARVDQAQRCAVQTGDVFFTPTSEVRNDIGHSAVAMEDIPDGAYSYHVVRLRIKGDWDLRFRAYAFKTKAFMDQASTLCEGSGTRYVITLPKFRSMGVHVPSDKDEQAAIATILSDMDEEIAALESRREKTRLLKQGMMQELLTGRIRLVEPPQ